MDKSSRALVVVTIAVVDLAAGNARALGVEIK